MSNMRSLTRSVRRAQGRPLGNPKPAPKAEPLAIGPVQVTEVKPNLLARAKAALSRVFRASRGR